MLGRGLVAVLGDSARREGWLGPSAQAYEYSIHTASGARVLSGLKDLAAGRAVPILPRVCAPFLNMTSEEMLAATDLSIHSKERHVNALQNLTPGDNAWLPGFMPKPLRRLANLPGGAPGD
jgi:hypothetical protein